jgi:hypothetical protein
MGVMLDWAGEGQLSGSILQEKERLAGAAQASHFDCLHHILGARGAHTTQR